MSWIKDTFDRSMSNTKHSMTGIASYDEIIFLTVLAVIISGIQTVNVFLQIYNWININPSFDAYHPVTPLTGLVGWILYFLVISVKQVHKTSLLPFVPGVLGIFYSTLLFSFKFEILSPTIFKFW